MKKTNFKQVKTNSFKSELGEYKVIPTADDTITLWSGYFDECCHSLDGAWEETVYNYIEGTQVLKKAEQTSSLSIFEIGFAMGTGAQATFQALGINRPCSFVSCELDPKLVEWAIQHSSLELINKLQLKQRNDLHYYESSFQEQRLLVLLGDARASIPLALKEKLISKFDCFYQDPFSPKKNPRLWSVEWFELMSSMAKEGAILATYSASTSVRKAMLQAGWGVFNRKGFHGKRSSTYAIMGRESDLQVVKKLSESSVKPLRD